MRANRAVLGLAAALALLVGLAAVQWVQQRRLTARVAALEDRLASRGGERGARIGDKAGARGRGAGSEGSSERRRRGRGAAAARGGGSRGEAGDAVFGEATVDAATADWLVQSLDDPEARAQLEQFLDDYNAQQRDEQRARRAEMIEQRVSDEVEAFAAEHGLDADTADRLGQLLSASMDERMGLRDAMFDGDVEADEMRAAIEEIEARTDEEIEQLLGAELAGTLRDRLPRRGPPR